MPALSIGSSHIEEALRSSLVEGKQQDSLANLLISQSRAVLLKKIEFVDASNQTCEHHQKVKSKYVLTKMTEQLEKKPVVVLNGEHKKSLDGIGLPEPKIVLYDPAKLTTRWHTPLPRMGTGLNNLGNTCFCNATLQCLTFTPALYNYLMNREHSKCGHQGFCMMCVMEEHIKNTANRVGMGYSPWSVVKNFKAISKHFVLGRQEDAHEFLRYVIDNMAKVLLWGKPKLDSISKSTTAIHQIFGGFLRSQVRCKNCDYKSNTYDPFLDMALDIKEASNIHQALEHYTKGESLFGDNAYLCEKCKRKVGAVKRFSIHKAPQVMTLQLKRFDAVRLNKINRDVHFPETLNIRPYLSYRQGDPVLYSLYGVLVHQGFSTNSGHYFSFVKSPSGQWLKVDDSRVNKVGLEQVLRQTAYILFYNKTQSAVKKSLTQSPSIGPLMQGPKRQVLQARHTNGPMGNPINEIGTPVVRKNSNPNATATITRPGQQPSLITNPRPVQSSLKSPNGPNYSKIASLAGRDKISFGIKTKADMVQNKNTIDKNGSSTSSNGNTNIVSHSPNGGEKLVIKIKDGKVVSNTASPPQKKITLIQPNQNSSAAPQGIKRKLVPYGQGDGSSDSDDNSDSNIFDNLNKLKLSSNGNGNNKPDDNYVGTSQKGISKTNKNLENLSGSTMVNNHNNTSHNNSSYKTNIKNNNQPKQFQPILDEKLKTTTEVPGAYAPLDREKFHSNGNGFKSPPKFMSNGDRGHLTIKLSSPETVNVHSTSKWTVLDNDQKSPSVASSSSSVNSTSDWKTDDVANTSFGSSGKPKSGEFDNGVANEKKNEPHNNGQNGQNNKRSNYVPESLVNGWNVEDVRQKTSNTNAGNGQSGKSNAGKQNSQHQNPKITPPGPKIFQQGFCSSGGNNIENNGYVKQSPQYVYSNGHHNNRTATNSGERHFTDNLSQPIDAVINTNSGEVTVSPKKNLFAAYTNAGNSNGNEKHKSDSDPVNSASSFDTSLSTSDSQSVLEPQFDSGQQKKHKKKKKHKRDEKDKIKVYDYDSENETNFGDQPKKKKKKKRKYNDSETTLSSSALKKPNLEDEKVNGDTDTGLSACEEHPSKKTKECEEKTSPQIFIQTSDKPKPVPVVQKWDQSFNKTNQHHHLNAEKKHYGNDFHNQNRPYTAWDGSRGNHNGVLDELNKVSLQGYGTSVSGWDGGKSSIDQEVIRERRNNKKRNWEDEYEEQLNVGKIKKVKNYQREDRFGGPNLFQHAQSYNYPQKNKFNQRNLFDDISSRNHDHAYPHNNQGNQASNFGQRQSYGTYPRGNYHNSKPENFYGNGGNRPYKHNPYSNNQYSNNYYRHDNRNNYNRGRGRGSGGGYRGNFNNRYYNR